MDEFDSMQWIKNILNAHVVLTFQDYLADYGWKWCHSLAINDYES